MKPPRHHLDYRSPVREARRSRLALAAAWSTAGTPVALGCLFAYPVNHWVPPRLAPFVALGMLLLPSIVSGAASLVAFWRIERSNGRLTGRELAVAGVSVSGFELFFVLTGLLHTISHSAI